MKKKTKLIHKCSQSTPNFNYKNERLKRNSNLSKCQALRPIRLH